MMRWNWWDVVRLAALLVANAGREALRTAGFYYFVAAEATGRGRRLADPGRVVTGRPEKRQRPS